MQNRKVRYFFPHGNAFPRISAGVLFDVLDERGITLNEGNPYKEWRRWKERK